MTGTDARGYANVDIAAQSLSALIANVLYVNGFTTSVTTFVNAALSNTPANVKTSAGMVKGWFVYNPNAAVAYIQVFNALATNVTLGTTAPYFIIAIPAGSAANLLDILGITHSTAISWAATSTPTGSAAPTTALVATLFYV